MTLPASTRLHITPFSPDLLSIVLGPSLAKHVENISFQSTETFPENNYGFLDLPESDAKVLTAKLNGAILKGKKMKIEKARPKKRPHHLEEEEDPAHLDPSHKKAKKHKKTRKEEKEEADGVINGHQLSPERKVKRGWTDPKQEDSMRKKSKDKKEKRSKHQAPSRYTGREELLFRTKIPPNKEPSPSITRSKGTKQGVKRRANGTVVHEFENTEVQPAFVRDTAASAPIAEYVDGVGWVDAKGDIVEKAPLSASRRVLHRAEGLSIGIPTPAGAKTLSKQLEPSESTSTKSNSATGDDSVEPNLHEDVISASDLSPSSPEANANPEMNEEKGEGGEGKETAQVMPRVSIQRTPVTPEKVHPLEAIFKKPKPAIGQEDAKPSLEIETTFSFFESSAADDVDELPPMPTTPFTSRDMRSRGVRSAAPTPDTAHPSRFASFAGALAHLPAEEQSKNESTVGSTGNHATHAVSEISNDRPYSDFEKRFWAERGQNNRAWKTRRKGAIKDQRQRENRARRTGK